MMALLTTKFSLSMERRLVEKVTEESISELPNEMLAMIFKYLDSVSWRAILLVDKRFYEIGSHDILIESILSNPEYVKYPRLEKCFNITKRCLKDCTNTVNIAENCDIIFMVATCAITIKMYTYLNSEWIDCANSNNISFDHHNYTPSLDPECGHLPLFMWIPFACFIVLIPISEYLGRFCGFRISSLAKIKEIDLNRLYDKYKRWDKK
jgi:hypothetical protein